MNKILSIGATLATLAITAYYSAATYATISNNKRQETKTNVDNERQRQEDERENKRTQAYIANQQAQQKWNEQSNQREEIYLLHNMKKWNDEE